MKKTIQLLFLSFIVALGVQAQDLGNTTAASNSQKTVLVKDGMYFTENGKLYSGIYASVENGRKKAEIEIKEGKANGKATYYYQNGNVMETGTFANGEKNGEWLRWDEAGKKIAQAFYVSGKKDGLWIVWDSNGTKRYEMNYAMGEKVGKWMMWDEKGNLISEKEYSTI